MAEEKNRLAETHNLNELRARTQRLQALLTDPHPGLSTWLEMYGAAIDAIVEFRLNEPGEPPVFIPGEGLARHGLKSQLAAADTRYKALLEHCKELEESTRLDAMHAARAKIAALKAELEDKHTEELRVQRWHATFNAAISGAMTQQDWRRFEPGGELNFVTSIATGQLSIGFGPEDIAREVADRAHGPLKKAPT